MNNKKQIIINNSNEIDSISHVSTWLLEGNDATLKRNKFGPKWQYNTYYIIIRVARALFVGYNILIINGKI